MQPKKDDKGKKFIGFQSFRLSLELLGYGVLLMWRRGSLIFKFIGRWRLKQPPVDPPSLRNLQLYTSILQQNC